jgi:hypothetical protein
MDTWHKHLANTIALHSRGKHMEEVLNYKTLHGKTLSPSATLIAMERVEEIEKLYAKAYRMCKLLANTQEDDTVNLAALQDNIESSIRRISDIQNILKIKAKKWGFNDEVPDTQRSPGVFEDLNAAQDNPYMKMQGKPEVMDDSDDVDTMREEIKSALKALLDVIDYMEAPTLSKIQKRLDKLVEY